MRVAVIVAWRPKGHSEWQGRGDASAREVAPPLARDPAVAPYVGIHLASLLPRHWDITLVHECVRDVDLDMDVEAVFISTIEARTRHAVEDANPENLHALRRAALDYVRQQAPEFERLAALLGERRQSRPGTSVMFSS
jgi:hypothetical protein